MREQPNAEAFEKLARRTEFQNRRVGIAAIEACRVARRLVVETALKNPDIAIGSEMHPDDFTPFMPVGALHARRKRRPVRHKAIGIGEIGRLRIRSTVFIILGLRSLLSVLGASRCLSSQHDRSY